MLIFLVYLPIKSNKLFPQGKARTTNSLSQKEVGQTI